jgi:hypothetical protein
MSTRKIRIPDWKERRRYRALELKRAGWTHEIRTKVNTSSVSVFRIGFLQREVYNIAAMCGAYGFSVKDVDEVYNRFDIVNTLEDFRPRFNIRPGQMNPVIVSHSPNQITRMFWGLIPRWAKEFKPLKYSTINAKADTVAELSSYRKPFREHRCL